MINRHFMAPFQATRRMHASMLLVLVTSLAQAQLIIPNDRVDAIAVDANDEASPASQGVPDNANATDLEDPSRKEADAALEALSNLIRTAPASRTTVALSARTSIGQETVNIDKAIYQISSRSPNCYAAHFKSSDQSFRVYCDSEFTGVQIGEDAYFKTDSPDSLQMVVRELPVPLGPYPEPVMALSLAGIDMKASFMADMQSIEVVDREPFNQTAAVHLHGVQADEVTWDLWISTEKDKVQPLRMVINLTNILSTGDDSELPEGFRYEIEFLFTLYRMNGNYEAKLFTYAPPANAIEYDSLDAYYEALSDIPDEHALTGQLAPDFEAELLPASKDKVRESDQENDKVETQAGENPLVKLSDLKGKIVVLDFWATWCGPCIEAMPVINRVTAKYAEKGVEFYALNIGESEQDVQLFFETAKAHPKVLLDPQSVVADAYKAEAIPQTVLIGRDGRIEMVHVGYESLETLEQQLDEQLKILVNGGSLLSASQAN